jgi:peptide/nickel transport system substrate-binding protein
MRIRRRGYSAVVGLAALTLGVAACGGSTTTSSGTPSTGTIAGFQGLNPGGTPKAGGTLNMLGTSDVDYLDPNITYYTTGQLMARMYNRSLYTYPAVPGKTTVANTPDLATAAPTVSSDGLTYTVTIRTGAMWDTTPARQVTGDDAVLGLKRACNPTQPFGGLPDFNTLVVGYSAFCTAFAKVSTTSAAAQKAFINSHPISGVSASGETVTYKLAHPASYFASILALPPFSPVPAEYLTYIPGSASLQQNTLSDGPYKVQTYTPTKQIVLVRNPAWTASTDPLRKAYVDKIVVNETGTQTTVQQQLQTNTAAASMEFDAFPPIGAVPGLMSQMNSGLNHNFNLGATYSTNPYIVFNTVSPNNGRALNKVAVRQALSYGIDRAHLIQDDGGPAVAPPLTHVLPPGINGSQDVPAGFDAYPYDPAKAKSLLAQAGFPNGFTLKMLYRPQSSVSTKIFATLQADLAKIGVTVTGVTASQADFYVKYLTVPSVAQRGVWDISLAGWGPDWYGDAALSFFGPLFSGAASYPPTGSDFGFYNNPAVLALVGQAATSASATAAASLWAQADQKVMQDAAIFPITAPNQPLYHASYVHNAIYLAAWQQFDPANVWLSAP